MDMEQFKAVMVVLIEMMDAEETKQRIETAVAEAHDDFQKVMTTVFPVLFEIMGGVLTKHGLDGSPEGIQKFQQDVAMFKNDPRMEIMKMAEELKKKMPGQ